MLPNTFLARRAASGILLLAEGSARPARCSWSRERGLAVNPLAAVHPELIEVPGPIGPVSPVFGPGHRD